MKWLGIILVVTGFVWIVVDITSFTSFQYTRWMWQSENLPAGDLVSRAEAVNALRDLSVSLNEKQKSTLIPALCMLIGGLMAGFGKNRCGKV